MRKIIKPFFLILMTHYLSLNPCFSQTAPGIEWQNTIGGNDKDRLFSIRQTADGGYILGGYSHSDSSGDKTEDNIGPSFTSDYWIVKIDATGNIQWQNTIGGSSNEWFESIQQTTDGGYILGGHSMSNISSDKTENGFGNWDYWIVKTNSAGIIQWQNTIGGSDADVLHSVQQTTDGGFIIGGTSHSNISGDKTEDSMAGDYWVVKTDSLGNIQWQNTIGGSDAEELYSIEQTADGGYILGGYSRSNISGDKTESNLDTVCLPACTADYWIVKIDATGNIQWQNTIGGSSHDYLYSIQQTDDGGFILGGFSSSHISGDKTENSMGGDYWIVKADSVGSILWQNTIGGNNADVLHSIQQTSDGDYILGGYSQSDSSFDKTESNYDSTLNTPDYWIVKATPAGNIRWQNTIGGNNFDVLYFIEQTADGGYILGGWSDSGITGDKTENNMGGWGDYWIVKLSADTLTGISNIQFPIYDFSIYPNPATDIINIITSNSERSEIILYDITSRKILQMNFINSISLNTEPLAKGLYLYEVRIGNGLYKNGKVIKN